MLKKVALKYTSEMLTRRARKRAGVLPEGATKEKTVPSKNTYTKYLTKDNKVCIIVLKRNSIIKNAKDVKMLK